MRNDASFEYISLVLRMAADLIDLGQYDAVLAMCNEVKSEDGNVHRCLDFSYPTTKGADLAQSLAAALTLRDGRPYDIIDGQFVRLDDPEGL